MKMTSTKGGVRARLLTSTLLAGLATVAAPLAITAVATAIPTLVSAQDYTSGTLVGTVTDSSGAPVTGAAVVVKSTTTGLTRSLTTNSDGQFRAALIPLGAYNVSVSKDGFEPIANSAASVRLGGESAFGFTLLAPGEVDAVVVTGTANPQLDFAATTKGVSIDVETLSKQMPIARNVTAVALLAPSVVAGNGSADFRGLPSIGGSSVAENAFYLNGLNITNFDTYVGGSVVPFEFYKTVEVKTGGYPAEFGRATGGVVNAVTKSGSNDFHFALHGNYEPNSLRETPPDISTSLGESKGNRRAQMTRDYVVELSGPIIEDHLFFYGLYQGRDTYTKQATASQYIVDRSNDPFWGAKLDAYITDRQRVEFTYFDTTRQTDRASYNYNIGTDTIGARVPGSAFELGGKNYVGKYTGSFTDWFTLSAAYGVSEDRNSTLPEDTTGVVVVESRFTAPPPIGTNTPAFTSSSQKTANTEVSTTRREFYRADADFYFNLVGKHHVRAGFDQEDNTLFHILQRSGGRAYTLRRGVGTGTGYGVAAGQDFIEVRTLQFGGTEIESTNRSFYVQDAWDVTDDFSVQVGIRNDSFKLGNLMKETVLNLKNNWGPRVGFTWDPVGDKKTKISASYGRYFIPPASNLSFRGADLGFSEFYLAPAGGITYAANGAPILGSQITTTTNPTLGNTFNITNCPVQAVGAGVDGCRMTYGRGIPEPAYSKTSKNLKATYEDEFIIGAERQLSPLWSAGVSLTYRTLHRVSEDITLDPYVVSKYCGADAACQDQWDGSWQYVVINPGEDISILSRGPLHAGDAGPTLMTFTKEELKFPKPKREYIGLELSFERAFDGKWGLQGSYTLSQSKGNYEGTVLSDVGQDDAGSTQLFDFAGLTDYQYGLLPNHHAHQFKLFGNYAITDSLSIGGNYRLTSPQHYSCLGVHPTDQLAASYISSSRYCAGVAAPRGTLLKTDWINNLDLSVRYNVPTSILPVGGLTLRADVFNVLNTQKVSELDEVYDDDGTTKLSTWGAPLSYQTPRYVRVGFDLSF